MKKTNLISMIVLITISPFYELCQAIDKDCKTLMIETFGDKKRDISIKEVSSGDKKRDISIKEVSPKQVLSQPVTYNGKRFVGVCRKAKAFGFDLEYEKAKTILKILDIKKTTDINETVVVIQRYPDGFYSHSNFCVLEYDFPSKVCADITDLKMILANVLYNEPPQDKELKRFFDAYENHVSFVLFENVFSEMGHALDITNLRQFRIVDKGGRVIKVARSKPATDNFNISFDMRRKRSQDCPETRFGDFGSLIDKLIEFVFCGISHSG